MLAEVALRRVKVYKLEREGMVLGRKLGLNQVLQEDNSRPI